LVASGSPLGAYSAPPLEYVPTFSFFLESTEITGSPASRRHRWPFRHRDGGRSTKYVLNYPN